MRCFADIPLEKTKGLLLYFLAVLLWYFTMEMNRCPLNWIFPILVYTCPNCCGGTPRNYHPTVVRMLVSYSFEATCYIADF